MMKNVLDSTSRAAFMLLLLKIGVLLLKIGEKSAARNTHLRYAHPHGGQDLSDRSLVIGYLLYNKGLNHLVKYKQSF